MASMKYEQLQHLLLDGSLLTDLFLKRRRKTIKKGQTLW